MEDRREYERQYRIQYQAKLNAWRRENRTIVLNRARALQVNQCLGENFSDECMLLNLIA
jgi:hypothetical protein